MIVLHDKESGARIGAITEEQLRFLADNLQEETEEDKDYYIDVATIEFLEEEGADARLVEMLRGALGGRESMEVQWSRS
jgi:processive 1,2-diacylglycerol beta-glucosyltransferase